MLEDFRDPPLTWPPYYAHLSENMMLPKVHIFMVMYCCQLIIEFVYPFVVIISLQQFVLSVFYTSPWSFGLTIDKIGNKNKTPMRETGFSHDIFLKFSPKIRLALT